MVEDDDLLEKLILFGIKSVLILINDLIASLSIIKNFWKPKMDSNHTYLSVISLYSALKKDENYYLQCF